MCSSRRRPSAPAGCERAKSSAVKPRASSSATASASPSTSAVVVLEVGARPSGQASSGALASRCTSAIADRREPGRPVIAIDAVALALERREDGQDLVGLAGIRQRQHHVASFTMPRSPWLASPGCRKKAGVPVEDRVAAILRGDVPGLAHAGAHHAAAAGQQQSAGAGEIRADARLQRLQRPAPRSRSRAVRWRPACRRRGMLRRAGRSSVGAGGMMTGPHCTACQ